MVSEYILADRTTADKWSIIIDDGELLYSTTVSAAQAEPIFEDDSNPGSYYRLFISDGELAIEDTGTVQDDLIELEDVSTADVWKLIVDDGGLAYINVVEEVLISRLTVRVSSSNNLVSKVTVVYSLAIKNLVSRLIVRVNSSVNLVSKVTVYISSSKGILFVVYVSPAVTGDFIMYSKVSSTFLMNSLVKM